MNRFFMLAGLLALLPVVVALAPQSQDQGQEKPVPVSFKKDLLPLVEENCTRCHGKRASGGLDLRTPEAWKKGGRSGKLWDLEKIDKSVLLIRIESDKGGPQMPKMGKPMKEEEQALFRTWVKEGANFDVE